MQYVIAEALSEAKTVATCIHGHGDPPRISRRPVMETLISGGSVSSFHPTGFRRFCRKLCSRGMFSSNPSVVNVNPGNAYPHRGLTGGADNPGNGSPGSGGGRGGANNRHSDGNDEPSGHHGSVLSLLLPLPGIQALLRYTDEGKFYEHKAVYEILCFLMSRWVLTLPLAHAQSHCTHEYMMIGDDEHVVVSLVDDAHDVNGALDMYDSFQMEALSTRQVEEMNLHALETHSQSEKHSLIGRNGFKETDISSATVSTHLLQGAMRWLELLIPPAYAAQVASSGSTSKVEQVKQQESTILSSEGVVSSREAVSDTGGKPVGAKPSDVSTLKRLQREAFFELMKLREKLEKLEQITQARQKLERLGGALGGARTHLNGEIKAGTAFIVLEDYNSRHVKDSLEQAGMQTGLNVKFTFETPFRESDVLITQILSGQNSSVGGGRALGGLLKLGKLHYVAHVNDEISFSFVPLGAQAQDVTESVNVLQGQGLTAFSSQGPALFNYCKGSALGATVSGSKFAFSLAQYLAGWDNHASATETSSSEDPLCYATLGQFLFQPTEGFIISFCGLNRYWPTPPLPSSMSLHWSEMGPLVFPWIKSEKANSATTLVDSNGGLNMNRSHSHREPADLECGFNAFENKGTGLFSFAMSSSFDFGENMSLSSWAQIERGEMLQDPDKWNFQWAFSVAKTSGSGIDWGASIGASQYDICHMSSSSCDIYSGYHGTDLHGSQLQVEAFLKLTCGKGFTLQPGLLYVANKASHTPALIIRSSWSL